jgi:pimeloyl-ACP methyl ester carboxylesterase
MLIPGFLAGDGSLGLMTKWLRRTGHRTCRAGMRSNVDCSTASLERLEARLEQFAEKQGGRVTIIGQSRGGTFARVLAVRRPDLVAGIITLGSPLRDSLALHPIVRFSILTVGALGTIGAKGLFKHSCRYGNCCTDFWEDLRAPFPEDVGFLSIYSKKDGIVDWRSCLDPAAEHLEVSASHIGMGLNRQAYRAVAFALRGFRDESMGNQKAARRAVRAA